MLSFSCYYRADSHAEVFSQITHPIMTRILDLVLIAGSFIMGFVMIVMIILIAAYSFIGKSYDIKLLDETARTISPADTDILKRDINEAAAKILEDETDVKKYVRGNISVDDSMLRESLNERVEKEAENGD